MVVTIEHKEHQILLKRTLVKAHASFDGATPKKMDLRKQLAKELKVKDEQVIVRHIHNSYGKHSASVEAIVYEKAEDAIALENKKLIEKHAIKVAEKTDDSAQKAE